MPTICGTDFSETAERACRVAAAWARRTDGKLLLVHCVEPVATDPVNAELILQKLIESAEGAIAMAARGLKDLGVDVSTRVTVGMADLQIRKVAEEIGATLIVVGWVGHRRIAHLLMGSTAEHLAEKAPVPVLLVRNSETLERWLLHDTPPKIMIATDLSAATDAAMEWSAEVPLAESSQYILAHAFWPPHEYSRLGLHGPIELDRTHPIVQDVLQRDLQTEARKLGPEARVKIELASSLGRPADSIAAIAAKERPDLLVLAMHHWGMMRRLIRGSVSKGILHGTSTNIVCIPPPKAEESLTQPEIRTILAATDFSPMGAAAVAYAYALAPAGGTVVLLHAKEDGENAEDAFSALRALISPEDELRGVVTEFRLDEENLPARAVCAAAERVGADLICLGSRGRSGLPRMMLGSVSSEVLLSSSRPVLLIRSLPRD